MFTNKLKRIKENAVMKAIEVENLTKRFDNRGGAIVALDHILSMWKTERYLECLDQTVQVRQP